MNTNVIPLKTKDINKPILFDIKEHTNTIDSVRQDKLKVLNKDVYFRTYILIETIETYCYTLTTRSHKGKSKYNSNLMIFTLDEVIRRTLNYASVYSPTDNIQWPRETDMSRSYLDEELKVDIKGCASISYTDRILNYIEIITKSGKEYFYIREWIENRYILSIFHVPSKMYISYYVEPVQEFFNAACYDHPKSTKFNVFRNKESIDSLKRYTTIKNVTSSITSNTLEEIKQKAGFSPAPSNVILIPPIYIPCVWDTTIFHI